MSTNAKNNNQAYEENEPHDNEIDGTPPVASELSGHNDVQENNDSGTPSLKKKRKPLFLVIALVVAAVLIFGGSIIVGKYLNAPDMGSRVYDGPEVDYTTKPVTLTFNDEREIVAANRQGTVVAFAVVEPQKKAANKKAEKAANDADNPPAQGNQGAQQRGINTEFDRLGPDGIDKILTLKNYYPLAVGDDFGVVVKNGSDEISVVDFSTQELTPLLKTEVAQRAQAFVFDSTIIINSFSSNPQAFDAHGKKLWETDVPEGSFMSDIFSSNSIAVIASSDKTFGIDMKTGKKVVTVGPGVEIYAFADGYLKVSPDKTEFYNGSKKIGEIKDTRILNREFSLVTVEELYELARGYVSAHQEKLSKNQSLLFCQGRPIVTSQDDERNESSIDIEGTKVSFGFNMCSPTSSTALLYYQDNEAQRFGGINLDEPDKLIWEEDYVSNTDSVLMVGPYIAVQHHINLGDGNFHLGDTVKIYGIK